MTPVLFVLFIAGMLAWALAEVFNPRNNDKIGYIVLFTICWCIIVGSIWIGVL